MITKPEVEKKDNLKNILIGLNILQLVVVIVLAVMLSNKSSEITTLNEQITTKTDTLEGTKSELEDLKGEYDRIAEERNKLGLDNEELNKQREELDTQINKLKTQGKLSEGEKKQLRSLIAKMKDDLVKKDQEIALLLSENDSLSTNVNRLSQEKSQLGDSINNLSSSKNALADHLRKASVLKAEGVQIFGIKSNGKELEGPEFKASRIETIRIQFKVADNRAAEVGEKIFYLRMIMPSGKAFSDPINGGGTIPLENGNEVQYTLSQKIAFHNKGETVNMKLPKGFEFKAGNYLVEVYQEGFFIGEGKFMIK